MEDLLPAFNADTLSSLTQKIKSTLHNPGDRPVSKPTAAEKKGRKEKDRKQKSNESKLPKAPALKQPTNIRNGKTQALEKRKPIPLPKSDQGQKRLRDGTVKTSSYQENGDAVKSLKLGKERRKPAEGSSNDIVEDVRALGGTQDDINLVANATSDSEVEGEDISGVELTREVQQLIRQLGVDKMGQMAQADDTESNQENSTFLETQANLTHTKGTSGQESDMKSDQAITRATAKGQRSLVVQPQSEWHAIELPELTPTSLENKLLPPELSDRLHAHARSLLEHENEQYAAHSTSASSAHQFYSTIMSTGTLSDKISALTLSVQESPIHNMKALEGLVGLARKRSRGQAVEVLGALKDLFGPGNLLPSDRKLRNFAAQPALSGIFDRQDFEWMITDPLPKPLQERHLILWAYEDWLKSRYFEILKILEIWCNDEVVFARGRAVDYVCQLLKEKPEQEANLLRLLVNKLGDSDKKIASKTSFHILQLETAHPLMKPTIITAIESDLLFRSGQSLHAKYYAIITLNQTVLSGKEEGVAKKLLDIYFSLFIELLKRPEPVKPALTGSNDITINRKGEVQGGGGAGGKKALKKLAEQKKVTAVDEELREKMLSAVLTGVNRAIPFTNTNEESFERHLDTLFKVTHSSNFNTSVQALMLIQQLHGSHQGSADRFYRTLYESLLDPRLLTSSKQALYLNLLFRALRADLNVKRVQAFAKRLLQVVAMHQPSFTCGTIYLLRELEGVFANLEAFIDQPEEDSDDEEYFKDVDETNPDVPPPSKNKPQPLNPLPPITPHQRTKYSGLKRDPSHSNASHSSLWELTPFLTHYHPSVSLFATRLLTHAPMPPKPDLSLNTLIHFLDRFVYRNPKATNNLKGASIMQPMAGGDSSGAVLVSATSNKERSRQPVNSESFWKQEAEKVGADEVFFHRYFSALGRGREKAKRKKEGKRKDADGSESEGDEDEIWKALVDSRPEVEGGSDGGVFSEDDDDLGSALQSIDDEDKHEQLDLERHNAKDAIDSDEPLALDEDGDDALMASDDELPSDLEAAFNAEVQTRKTKPKTKAAMEEPEPEKGEKPSKKRRRLKNLPTFASVDEYAGMLDGDGDGNEED